MMNDNQFKRNYMEFVTRIGELEDIAYKRLNNEFYNDRMQARFDALIDAMYDIVDMAYNDGSDYFMQQAIEHGQHMYNVYKDTNNVADATYYMYYYRRMQKFRTIYLQCMTY